MRVGISFTSPEAARANLAGEVQPNDTVTTVASDAERQWDGQLRRIEVTGGSREQLTKLYTAVYHVFLQPNVVSDLEGTYYGGDGRVHRLANGQRAQYGNFSGWISTALTRSCSLCSSPGSQVTMRSPCSTTPRPTTECGTAGSI